MYNLNNASFLHSYLKFVAILYQRTPLHIAAREGYDSTVEYLADKKADMNIEDDYGVCEAYYWQCITIASLHYNLCLHK